MVRIILFSVFFFLSGSSVSQDLRLSPEVLLGDRSFFYQHQLQMKLKERWSFQNTFLLDKEYVSNGIKIFFFRNSLVVNAVKNQSFNLAFGLKNPGPFSTISWSYKNGSKYHSFSYSIGCTYQRGVSLEQSLFFRRDFLSVAGYKWYYQVFAVSNFNADGYVRGLQQLRLGIEKDGVQFGIGVNFDQFNNAASTLVNQGGFVKLKINKSYKNEK